MVFSVRSTVVRVAVLGAAVFALANSASAAAANSPLNHLDNADLLDLLDADLDEDFLTKGFRNLQNEEITEAPTPAPLSLERGGEFTASPTLPVETAAPTPVDASPGILTPPPVDETSGTMSLRSASGVVVAAAAVMATAVAVVMA